MVGSRTYLFWASFNSEASKESENSLFSLLGRIEEENDDPNRRIKLVYDTFQSIYNGKLSANDDDKFFILGLARDCIPFLEMLLLEESQVMRLPTFLMLW